MSNIKRIRSFDPATVLVFGYLSYVVFGWLLLSLPWAQNQAVTSLDNLFIAVSAVSTTGLVTVDPGQSYTFFGQLIILLCIQVGGIGYMTFGSFVLLTMRSKLTGTRKELTKHTFSMPQDFSPFQFIKVVIFFTLISEAVGAVLLYAIFTFNDLDGALWLAIFHSISAFCTAGFSLFSNSFESFSNNTYLNLVIAALSYLGAIGFIVVADMWNSITGQIKNLHFSSKVILQITFYFTLVGTFLLFAFEPSIQSLLPWERLLASFFQVMTSTTTVGFNTVPIGQISAAMIMVLYFLMVFGASPSGTGGGLKSTTLAVLFASMKSTLKRRDMVRLKKRSISNDRIQLATASLVFYLMVLFVAVTLLLMTQKSTLQVIIFEAISAMGTVGLSMGLTGSLTELGKFIIIVLMFMGRVGIMTFGIAITSKDETREEESDNDLVI